MMLVPGTGILFGRLHFRAADINFGDLSPDRFSYCRNVEDALCS